MGCESCDVMKYSNLANDVKRNANLIPTNHNAQSIVFLFLSSIYSSPLTIREVIYAGMQGNEKLYIEANVETFMEC